MRDRTRPGLRPLIVRSAVMVSVALLMVVAPFLAASQPAPVFRIGHLAAGGRTPDGGPPRPLREGLKALGYVEGQNVVYEVRFAEGKMERLPALAAELVRLKVDVLVAQGGPAGPAAKEATRPFPSSLHPPRGTPWRPG